MYITIRRYAGNAELADQLVAHEEEVSALVSGVPGFHAYFLARSGSDTVTVTVTEGEEGASESSQVAANWLRENLPDVAAAPPEISSGEVLLSATS
jgi:hypothetical protein